MRESTARSTSRSSPPRRSAWPRPGRRAGCRHCASRASRRSRRRPSSEPQGLFSRHHNRGRMNRKVTVGIVAALLVGAAAYAWLGPAAVGDASVSAAAAPASSASAAAGPPVSVTTVVVQKKDVDVMLEATGTVTALNSVDIRPQVASTITKVQIREGQFVNAGQPLFVLDARNDE